MLTRGAASARRIVERLDRLYAIGGGRGANRPGYSPAEDEAHELVAGWMAAAGLEVERDVGGNLIGRLHGRDPASPEVWTGSHLDSVPEGGRFDGTLGVVAGLEAVERAGQGDRTLGVVAFRDEERGCSGSRARVRAGAELPGVFVEAHVEQGPLLDRADAPLGVVTGIVGYARGEAVVVGRPGHAGTTPMDARDDALCGAAELVLALREAALEIEGAVATVGSLSVEPGAANVVPARVWLSIDARAPDRKRLDALVEAIRALVDVELRRVEPVALSPRVRALLSRVLGEAEVPCLELPSGAGHDAGILAAAGVEAGMLFARSRRGGVSHSPEELTTEDDVALCADALTAALQRLASD